MVMKFSARKEIPRIVWNPKFRYILHKSRTPVSILRQINLVLTTNSLLYDSF
jgi:hypothetical protein